MPLGGHGAEMLRSIRKNKAQLHKRESLYEREQVKVKNNAPYKAGNKELTEDQLYYIKKRLEEKKRKLNFLY